MGGPGVSQRAGGHTTPEGGCAPLTGSTMAGSPFSPFKLGPCKTPKWLRAWAGVKGSKLPMWPLDPVSWPQLVGGAQSSPPALPEEPGSPSPPAQRGQTAPGSQGPRRSSSRSPAAPCCQPQRLHLPQVQAQAPHQRPKGWGRCWGCKAVGPPPPAPAPSPGATSKGSVPFRATLTVVARLEGSGGGELSSADGVGVGALALGDAERAQGEEGSAAAEGGAGP